MPKFDEDVLKKNLIMNDFQRGIGEIDEYGNQKSKYESYEYNQKDFVDKLVANVEAVRETKKKNLVKRIDESKKSLHHPDSVKNDEEVMVGYKEFIENDMGPSMQDTVTLFSDTHGDALSLAASLGDAIKFVPNEYEYCDEATFDSYSKITDIENFAEKMKANQIIMIPKMIPNENFKGMIVHAGDLTDRGRENRVSYAIAARSKEILGDKIFYICGNHEFSANTDGGAKRFQKELAACYHKGVFCPSVTIQNDNGHKTSIQHCQLTKKELPVMFRMYLDMASPDESQTANEINSKISRSLYAPVLRENYNSFRSEFLNLLDSDKYKSLKPKIDNLINNRNLVDKFIGDEPQITLNADSKNLYNVLKRNEFSDSDFFLMKDLLVDLQMKMYADVWETAKRRPCAFFFCAKIFRCDF